MILIDSKSGRPRFVYVSWIGSTPQKVFEALTRPEFTQRYWFGTGSARDGSPATPSSSTSGSGHGKRAG